LIGLSIGAVSSDALAANSTLMGVVERVWEDGFQLNTGEESVEVDAWDLCDDSTQQYVSVDDQLTVMGEFSDGEFDATAITNAAGEAVCP
jgi:FlaG/FlaF family flagellin (archaellin)